MVMNERFFFKDEKKTSFKIAINFSHQPFSTILYSIQCLGAQKKNENSILNLNEAKRPTNYAI